MSIKKGTRLPKFTDEVISRRVLVRCLELESQGVLPTIGNIGNMGCNRDRVLRIRNQMIREGLIKLPTNRYGVVIRSFSKYDDFTAEDPTPREQQEIQARIEEIRLKKMSRPDRFMPVVFRERRFSMDRRVRPGRYLDQGDTPW